MLTPQIASNNAIFFILFISTSRSFIANYTLDGFFEKILLLTYVLKFHTEIRNNMSLLVAKVEMLRG
ncbi:hypothetical protein B8A40_02985 [Dolosigranulum pigrum]|nr:hypothetical protein B8A40_02985 [Dolosigranulum pigrum]